MKKVAESKWKKIVISDVQGLHGHDDKIRIVLNKADMVDHQVCFGEIDKNPSPTIPSGTDESVWSSYVELGQGIIPFEARN